MNRKQSKYTGQQHFSLFTIHYSFFICYKDTYHPHPTVLHRPERIRPAGNPHVF